MKNLLKVIMIMLFMITGYTVSSQPPPPPTGTSGGGSSSEQLGGNAPVGGGLFILLGLGTAYAGRKIYKLNVEELED